MKSLSVKLSVAIALMFGVAGTVGAATPGSTSYKYFDESGALVGQSILFCSNLGYHAGNIHTAYYVAEGIACGSNPPPHAIVPGTQVMSYTLPSFLTISAACGLAECIQAGWSPIPELTDKGWTWLSGFQ